MKLLFSKVILTKLVIKHMNAYMFVAMCSFRSTICSFYITLFIAKDLASGTAASWQKLTYIFTHIYLKSQNVY